MNAIVTGSHAYGKPRPDSDVDVVVLVTEDDKMLLVGLAAIADPKAGFKTKRLCEHNLEGDYAGVGANAAVLRFGILNLLITTDPLSFEVWRRGTEQLIAHKQKTGQPVSREVAVQHLKNLREHCGVAIQEPQVNQAVEEVADEGSDPYPIHEAETDLY